MIEKTSIKRLLVLAKRIKNIAPSRGWKICSEKDVLQILMLSLFSEEDTKRILAKPYFYLELSPSQCDKLILFGNALVTYPTLSYATARASLFLGSVSRSPLRA